MSLLLKQFLSALALLACAVAATDAEGMAFLAANADKEGVTVLGSGLQYRFLCRLAAPLEEHMLS